MALGLKMTAWRSIRPATPREQLGSTFYSFTFLINTRLFRFGRLVAVGSNFVQKQPIPA